MTQPTLKSEHTPRRRSVWIWLASQPLGLPLFEVIWGVLFLLGLMAALAIAIWSSLVDGHG